MNWPDFVIGCCVGGLVALYISWRTIHAEGQELVRRAASCPRADCPVNLCDIEEIE